MNAKLTDLGGKSMDKGKYKEIIKNVNKEINERNTFYGDEMKRIKEDKNANNKKWKAEIELLTRLLEEEKEKNREAAEKLRILEINISKLNDELSSLFNDS